MTTATRRTIARICIWVCVILVAIAALSFTITPHAYPFSAVLRMDIPAIVSIIFARVYLHTTRARNGS